MAVRMAVALGLPGDRATRYSAQKATGEVADATGEEQTEEGEHRRRSPATCGGGRRTDGTAGARVEEIGAERGARFIAQETEGTRGGTVAWRARRAQAVRGTAAAPRHGGRREPAR
jgi:hypothetical protein